MIRKGKYIILTFLLSCAFLRSSAINFEGIIVTKSSDTINCQIFFVDNGFYAYRGEILSTKKITVLIEGEKTTYSADELIYYSILMSDNWKTYWSVNTKKKEYKFMKREVHGKLTLYSSIIYNSIQLKYDRYFLFEKINTSERLYLKFGVANGRQKLTQFFIDCPTATGMLYSKELNVGDRSHSRLIAESYNENC